jgi:hypothetical protein
MSASENEVESTSARAVVLSGNAGRPGTGEASAHKSEAGVMVDGDVTIDNSGSLQALSTNTDIL